MRPVRCLIGLGLAALVCLAPAFAERPAPSRDLVTGIEAYNRGDFDGARRHLQAAADRGEAEAMVNLGYLYARGQGVPRNPDVALQLYRRAAATGDGEAMNAVGYRYNFATPPDLDKAIEWYCRAVFAGNPRAMNNLALLFYRGQGIPVDRNEARSLWRQSSERGHMNATALLAWDQASDMSLSPEQRREGADKLRDAAMRGSAVAQEVLRNAGSQERFPPPSESSLTMKLEPRNPVAGTSRACSSLIS